MWVARWLLPALIAVPFLGVVAVDLYSALTTPVPFGPETVSLARAFFEPDDYVIDLRRTAAGDASVEATAGLVLEQGWGGLAAGGRWTASERASLLVQLPVGGQEALLVQCRPDRRRGGLPRLQVTVNGAHIAHITLGRELDVYRATLPEGSLTGGDNRIELLLTDADGRAAAGRTLLVRRLALAGDPEADLQELVHRRMVRMDEGRGEVVIAAPGRLIVPFDVPRPGSSLTLHYRFLEPRPDAGCTVVMGRSYPDQGAVDVMVREPLLPTPDGAGELRLFLGHHRGASVLWVRADRAAAAAGVELEQLRLAVAGS